MVCGGGIAPNSLIYWIVGNIKFPSRKLGLEENNMITTSPLVRRRQFQINLVECKDVRGLVIRFHFEIVDYKSGKCVGICDYLLDAENKLDEITQKVS